MENVNRVQLRKTSSFSRGQVIGLISGIVLFYLTYSIIPIPGLSTAGRGVLATLALMGAWWMTELFNAGIIGLLPLVIFPLTQSLSASETAAAYGSNTIFMFFGGFALALALEKWNLHNRIALSIISFVGTSMTKLIAGLMLAATFITMWVSNTATILMLLPIAQAIGNTITDLMDQEGTLTEKDAINFKKSSILAVGFGAIIGGSITLIGTPTNIILAGFSSELLDYDISFAKFVLFELPIAIVQFFIILFFITKVFYRIDVKEVKLGKATIDEKKKALGKVSREEIVVSVVFILTVAFWMFQTLLQDYIVGISDTVISVTACVILYLLPSKSKGGRILESDSIKSMPWTMVLMIAGGMAIASGFTKTDLAEWFGSLLLNFSGYSEIVVITLVTFLSLLVTQFAPNTASSTILLPIAASLAHSMGINPLVLMTASALACGFACTMPCGTPVMGIIYGTNDFKMSELVKLGIVIAIVSQIMIVLTTKFYLPFVFGL